MRIVEQTFPTSMSWVGLVLCAGIVGCGDSAAQRKAEVHEVRGKVLLADGKPLSGGRVFFVPRDGALTSEGKIGPDGTFALETGISGAGAPVGEYKVRIEPEGGVPIQARKASRGKKPPFPVKYLDEDSSKLTALIRAESNRLEPFRLK